MKEGEVICRKTCTCNNTQTQTTTWRQPEGKGGGGGGQMGRNGGGKRLGWGNRHTRPCADDVLSTGTLGTCVVLLTNVTPVSSIHFKKDNANAQHIKYS